VAPADKPVGQFLPYLGDYDYLLAVENEFRGVFSANNTPDRANFPQGVTYQRAADFTTRTLSDGSGNPVAISIDPFYFSVPVLHEARSRHPTGEAGSMNTPRFFLAGILWMSLLVFGAGLLASGALPQATNNPAALAKQSSITFVGTVSQVAATTLAAVQNPADHCRSRRLPF